MLTNTLNLARFILRRERISLLIWIISIVSFIAMMPIIYEGMYPTEADLQSAMLMMDNPAFIALLGPNQGVYTIGALFTQEILLITIIIVAIMNILFGIRHTRTDEELGRLEMIRSLPVGRLANLSATLLVSLATNATIAILVGFGLLATGGEGIDLASSLLFGAVLGVSGLLFASITALFAQLTNSSRSAKGYAFTFLLVAYIIRAVGDVGNELLSHISPLGLVLKTEAYVNNYWWPLGVILIQAIMITLIAFYLNILRDLGAGFLAEKAGPKSASIFLKSPLGLSWRLLKNMIFAWTIGSLIIGFSFGAILGEAKTHLAGNEVLQTLLGSTNHDASLIEQFIPFLILLIAIIIAIPLVFVILKLKSEEKHNLTEHLFGRAVSKIQVITGYLFIAIASSIIFCLTVATGFWLGGLISLDEPINFTTFLSATLILLPALWIKIGFAVFLLGWLPKLTNIAILYLGYSSFVAFFGLMLNLPQWLMQLSPFEHIPGLPVDKMNWQSVIVVTFIALVLTVTGVVGYQKRDIQGW